MSLDTLDKLLKSGNKLTPMMSQYYEIKKDNAEHILLFRMGDFYEVFFDDAKEAAKILNIAQTHRGKIGDTPVPMAGIPHHAAINYVDKLTAAGKTVAICEQVQDPKDAVGIVKRAVTQVVSPGVPFDIGHADQGQNFFLCSFYASDSESNHYSIAFIDFASGKFFGFDKISKQEVISLLVKYSIKELITYPGQLVRLPEIDETLQGQNTLIKIISEENFLPEESNYQLEKFVPNYKNDRFLKNKKVMQSALSGVCNYLGSAQGNISLDHLEEFKIIPTDDHLQVSAHSLIGLEILPKSFKQKSFSLLGFCDQTLTAMGRRGIKRLFLHPLTCKKKITQRLDFNTNLLKNIDKTKDIRKTLDEMRDIERILTKICTNKSNSQDLVNLGNSLRNFLPLYQTIKDLNSDSLLDLNFNKKELSLISKIEASISEIFNPDISASAEKRNMINFGFSKERDDLWELSENGNKAFEKLELKYLEETKIPKIKIKHNNIHGHFIEISKLHSEKVPSYFSRRQTLVNSERYVTEELNKLAAESLLAREKLEAIEKQIFQTEVSKIVDSSKLVLKVSRAIEQVDVLQSLAWTAHLNNWSRPEFSKEQSHFQMINAWHPLIKNIIGETFTPHSLDLNKERYFGLITGPNMAGKTTVMREVAIIQFLAQLGSFVPAEKVSLSICDFIFSRLGASDNIQQGQSTFMVEMSEAAEITRHATKNSLVILDEIGRGTSTYDGLSIAWSLVNYFNKKIKCKCLFATHYHELIEVIDNLPTAKNLTVKTKKQGDEVHFLYELIEQGANQSFGIYVAKLAGLPSSVLVEAKNILHQLEGQNKKHDPNQLDLLNELTKTIKEPEPSPILSKEKLAIESLSDLNINNLTPLESLNEIKKLQDILQ